MTGVTLSGAIRALKRWAPDLPLRDAVGIAVMIFRPILGPAPLSARGKPCPKPASDEEAKNGWIGGAAQNFEHACLHARGELTAVEFVLPGATWREGLPLFLEWSRTYFWPRAEKRERDTLFDRAYEGLIAGLKPHGRGLPESDENAIRKAAAELWKMKPPSDIDFQGFCFDLVADLKLVLAANPYRRLWWIDSDGSMRLGWRQAVDAVRRKPKQPRFVPLASAPEGAYEVDLEALEEVARIHECVAGMRDEIDLAAVTSLCGDEPRQALARRLGVTAEKIRYREKKVAATLRQRVGEK